MEQIMTGEYATMMIFTAWLVGFLAGITATVLMYHYGKRLERMDKVI